MPKRPFDKTDTFSQFLRLWGLQRVGQYQVLEGEHFVVMVHFPEMAAVAAALGEVAPRQYGPAGAWPWVPELKPFQKGQTVALVIEKQVVGQEALDQVQVFSSCDISLPHTHHQTCCLPPLQKINLSHYRMLNHQGVHPCGLKF